MSFWTDFENAVVAKAKAFEAQLEAALKDIPQLVEAGAEEIANAAWAAVLAQAPLLISGKLKLKDATAAVVSALAAAGKSVGIQVAEAAVQSIVNKLSGMKSSTPPAAQ